ncbi:MAG: hypothetical protein ACFFAG_18975 [Promethearchaeota archaeon]
MIIFYFRQKYKIKYSINIKRVDEISQYIENLQELLPNTHPNVNLRSDSNLHRLKGDNRMELLTVFEALLEAIFQVDLLD